MKKITTLALAALFAVSAVLPDVSAGSIRGPRVATHICSAYSSVTYHETFRGGELGVVSIVGDSDTDLDLYVYDSAGRLVASGIGASDREMVSFVPLETQTYRIVVRNLGSVWNRYTIRMS